LEQHIIDLGIGRGSSRENDILIGNNNSGIITNDTNDSKSPTEKYELFPILYNECSLTTFANWAMLDNTTQWEKCKENHERHCATNRSDYTVTIPAPMFHMCGVCGGFGHYEVECESIHENRLQKRRRVDQTESKDSLLNEKERNLVVSNISKEVHIQRMQQQSLNAERQILVEKNPTSDDQYKSMACCKICFSSLDDTTMLVCDGCDGLFHCRCLNPPLRKIPTGDWFCDKCASHDDDVNSIAEIEGYGDFIIEQRKRSVAEANMDGTGINRGLTKDYWTTAISLLPASIPSVANTNLYLYKHLGREGGGKDFFIGEVCWAQRSNVWWPAKVKHNKSRRVKGISKQQTLYTVSFFALDEESDVPDTDILPFIPYYEDIGHRRFISDTDTTFRNALVECVSSLGIKSLGQCLQLARDGIQFTADENDCEHRNLLPIGFKIPPDWETANVDVIRDEVFLSKPKSGKKASPRSSRKKASAKKKQDSTNDVKSSYKPMVQEFTAHDLIGGIISWKSDLTTTSEVRYGLVISLDTTTEMVLVRMISLPSSDDELFYKNTSESLVVHTSNLGATAWIPLKSVRFVSSKPSLDDLDEFKKKLQVGIRNETDSYEKQFKEEATIRERFTLELQEIDDH